jgi:hypothetical protein
MPDTDPNLPAEDAPKGTDRFFSQEQVNELIEKARQQEKDKLYPQINRNDERWTALNEEVKGLRRVAKDAEKQEADRLAAVEAERTRAAEAEMSAKELIERRQAEFAAQLDTIQRENQSQMLLLQKENEFTRLQAYTQTRINEERDNIAPELIDLVSGNTPDEIEASIATMRAKTEAIAASMRDFQVQRRAGMPGVAPSAGTNGVTQLDQPGDRQLSDQDIKDMGMAQYAELRKKLGFSGANNNGLFKL